MNTFQITQTLSDVYPYIQKELENKHIRKITHLHKLFQQANIHPDCFIINNYILPLFITEHMHLHIPIENGIIAMLKIMDTHQNIVIQGNTIFQEMFFTSSGKLMDVQSNNDQNFLKKISKMIDIACQDVPISKRKGMLIYLHSSLPSKSINQEKELMILLTIFVSVIIANNLIEEFTKEELFVKIKQGHLFDYNEERFIAKYFDGSFQNKKIQGRFNHAPNDPPMYIQLDEKYRSVFCQLELLSNNPSKAFSKSSLTISNNILQEQLFQEKVTFYGFVENWWNNLLIVEKENPLLKQIQEMANQLKVKNCMITSDQNYIVFFVEKYRYAEVIGRMKKIINSKHVNHQAQALESRWKANKVLDDQIFSSGASSAFSIFRNTQSQMMMD